MSSRQRTSSLDIVRCFAFFCVVSVHFFRNTGFYDATVTGFSMYIMVLLRSFFMICVPLFIVLSGYLLGRKTPSGAYYSRIIPILAIYVLASLSCEAYRFFTSGSFSVFDTVISIFGFYCAPYAWYIEMYIGLYLLIPFINTLYHSLSTKHTKLCFLLTLITLTALPSAVNIWRFFDISWWQTPSISSDYYDIMPNWWTQLYPLTYYTIGLYLQEHPIKAKRSTVLSYCVIFFFAFGTFSFYRSFDSKFIDGLWQQHRSLFTTIQTVLVFTLITQGNYENIGSKLRTSIAMLSKWSMGAYLVSWIFDDIFYNMIFSFCNSPQEYFMYFPVIVLSICICSMALSAFLNYLHDYAIAPILNKILYRKTPSK